MSFKRWMDTHTVVHPDDGTDTALKTNELSRCKNTQKNLITESKKPVCTATHCTTTTFQHSAKGKMIKTTANDKTLVAGWGLVRQWGAESEQVEHRSLICRANHSPQLPRYCDGGHLTHCSCHNPQRHLLTLTTDLLTILYQYWLSNCSQCVAPIQGIDSSKTWGERLYENSVPSAQFLYNLTLLVKDSLKKKRGRIEVANEYSNCFQQY